MRPLLLTSLLLLAGCPPQEAENITGRLVHVEVVSTYDDCSPARYVGDGGTQFIGTLKDGTIIFTMSQVGVFGPLLDGGTNIESLSRHQIPVLDKGKGNAGNGEAECDGVFNDWETDGGSLTVKQYLPGAEECAGPAWLPSLRCTANRDFILTDVGTCQLSCIKLTAASDVVCDC